MKRDRPTSGDVVIVPDSAPGRGYTLSTAPDGPSQLWYPSYEHALQKALAWASASGVSVWRVNAGAQLERVPKRES